MGARIEEQTCEEELVLMCLESVRGRLGSEGGGLGGCGGRGQWEYADGGDGGRVVVAVS